MSRPILLAVALAAVALVATAPPPAASADAPAAPLEAPASDAPWARALVAALPRATHANDRDGNKLFDDLDAALLAAGPAARVPVIVSFVQGVATDDGVARARAAAPDAPVDTTFRVVPAYAGALRLDEALRVARLPEVRQIELDREGAPELDTATLLMGADVAVDALGVTGSLDGMPENFTGEDVAIAVLDTGIDGEHVDFADGKIVRFLDLGAGRDEQAYDNGGHGTHVASIAAGLGRGKEEYRGVAPGAALVGIKITGPGKSSMSLALAGYEWIVENKDALNIRVATMSFGFGIATDGTTALERAVDAAWDAGIVCFKSNGNSGPERGTMTVPAAARGILGIGSMLDAQPPSAAPLPVGGSGGFSLSTYSSRGPTTDGRVKPDLVAPGQAIMAAANGTKDEYVQLSGTSMAAPFAAGTAALVLAANPALAPDEVRALLVATAEDWGVAGPDVDYGNGRIRVDLAVREALLRAGETPAATDAPVVPFHEVRAGVVGQGAYEGALVVNDTTHPIAGTFIAEGKLLAVEIRSPSDELVGRASLPVPARQHVLGFAPTETGTYAFRVLAPPGTPFVVDFSHGTAPPLVELPQGVLEADDRSGLAPAATLEDGARVPGFAAPLAALAVALALGLARRRRDA